MPALPFPKYSIEKLYLFPIYHSRDEYKAAFAQDPPPFNPNLPPKYWFDPKAKDSARRSIIYDQVIATDAKGGELLDAHGKIQLDFLVLGKEEAGAVNIPGGSTNEPGSAAPPVVCPMRPLEANEELFFDFMGNIAVKNTELFDAQQSLFTPADRSLLQAIAKKLGV